MYSRATSNRLLYTLFVSQSLLSASQIAVYTLMTIVAARLAGTESVAGLPSSTLTFAQALTASRLPSSWDALGGGWVCRSVTPPPCSAGSSALSP